MKKTLEGNKTAGGEENSLQDSSKLPPGATVKSSSVKEKIKAFNVGNSPNVAHVSNTQARNINVISATTNSPNRAPLITSSPATQPSSSVSHTNVRGNLSVATHVENNQPTATASGNTVSGDFNMKVIGKYEKHIHQAPMSTEEKRIISQQKLEDRLQQLRRYRLKDETVQAELATYVPVQGGHSFEDNELFDVATKVKEFLANEKKVLLLLGDSGMGKSVFGQTLERELWEVYQPGNRIPLFISLTSLQDPIHQAIEEHLLQLHFKSRYVQRLKNSYSFVIILDGYDEIESKHPYNLYASNQLADWDAKIIITCRSQYLLEKDSAYRNRFLPDYKDQPEPGLYQEIVVKAFTPVQIETYLKKFVEVVKPLWSDWQRYQEHINTIPGLKGLIGNPFILRIAVEVLPDIIKRYEGEKDKDKDKEQILLTQLYDAFVQRWFERQELKLRKQGLLEAKWDIKHDFRNFSQQLAVKMHGKGLKEIAVEIKVNTYFGNQSVPSTASEWDEFFGDDERLQKIRKGCPLKKSGENRYAFIHESLLEYFAQFGLFEPTKKEKKKAEDKAKNNFFIQISKSPIQQSQNESLWPNMFNACQSGNLAEMKKLYEQGVSLTLKHPFNQATLLHVAIQPYLRPSGNGWESLSHCEIVEWLLAEISKSEENLIEIFNVKTTTPNPETKKNFTSYHPSTMLHTGNRDIKTLVDYCYSVVAGRPCGLAEAQGQTASPAYHTNLSFAQKTYNLFKRTKAAIDNYYAKMEASQKKQPGLR